MGGEIPSVVIARQQRERRALDTVFTFGERPGDKSSTDVYFIAQYTDCHQVVD